MFFKREDFHGMFDALGTAGTLGLHMVSATFVGLAIGYFLDQYTGWHPWFKLGFLGLGILAGFKMVWEDAHKLLREQKREEEKKREEQEK